MVEQANGVLRVLLGVISKVSGGRIPTQPVLGFMPCSNTRWIKPSNQWTPPSLAPTCHGVADLGPPISLGAMHPAESSCPNQLKFPRWAQKTVKSTKKPTPENFGAKCQKENSNLWVGGGVWTPVVKGWQNMVAFGPGPCLGEGVPGPQLHLLFHRTLPAPFLSVCVEEGAKNSRFYRFAFHCNLFFLMVCLIECTWCVCFIFSFGCLFECTWAFCNFCLS